MRRRLAFLSTVIALALVLVLPASALAANPFKYQILSDQCTSSAGNHGYGRLHLEVKQIEYGNSGANKMTFTASVQHRNLGSSRWRTEARFGTFTHRFANTRANNWYTRWYSWHPSDGNWHRIKVVLKVWHNGFLLAHKTVLGHYC